MFVPEIFYCLYKMDNVCFRAKSVPAKMMKKLLGTKRNTATRNN